MNNNGNNFEGFNFEPGDRIAVSIPAFGPNNTNRGIFISLDGTMLTWVAAILGDGAIGATVHVTSIEGGTIAKIS